MSTTAGRGWWGAPAHPRRGAGSRGRRRVPGEVLEEIEYATARWRTQTERFSPGSGRRSPGSRTARTPTWTGPRRRTPVRLPEPGRPPRDPRASLPYGRDRRPRADDPRDEGPGTLGPRAPAHPREGPRGLHGLIQLWIGDLAVRKRVERDGAGGVRGRRCVGAPRREPDAPGSPAPGGALARRGRDRHRSRGEGLQLLDARGASAAVRPPLLPPSPTRRIGNPSSAATAAARSSSVGPSSSRGTRSRSAASPSSTRRPGGRRRRSAARLSGPSSRRTEESYSTLAAQLERLGDAERAAACRRIAAKYASARGG